MNAVIDIPSLFAQLVSDASEALELDVYFDYGHYDAVNKNLVNKDGSITMKDQKYPLVWLITPFETRTNSRQDYACELSGLDILVLTNTGENISIPDRIENYFKPILWPIVQELKVQMVESGFFQLLDPGAIPYDYEKNWYYQGSVNGKTNLFNAYIDAVQIKNLRLKVNDLVPIGTRLR